MANKSKKLTRRSLALIWMLVVSIVIGVLIAYEQISILYVLATLSIVALLLIVGFADLEAVSRTDNAGKAEKARS
ncbi:MAG: hypothetical protein ABR530_03530 [Pyrinomonadaceae bacterium]